MSLENSLNPKTLERISRLDLKAKHIVEGIISGQHRSPFKGLSIEFSDHREYVSGDDLRHLDWKVFAKSEKYYIKQYEEETNFRAQILVDASESMNYGEGSSNKWSYAQVLTASIAYLITRQHDMAGMTIFDTADRVFLPHGTSRAHFSKICSLLEEATPQKGTSLLQVLNQAASQQVRKGIIIVISDFFADESETIKGLQRLRHKGHEVIAFQVMHRDEIEFPFKEYTKFKGLEDLGDITIQPQTVQQSYCEEVKRFLADLRRGCRKSGIDYQLFVTDVPLDVSLTYFLSSRNSRLFKGQV